MMSCERSGVIKPFVRKKDKKPTKNPLNAKSFFLERRKMLKKMIELRIVKQRRRVTVLSEVIARIQYNG